MQPSRPIPIDSVDRLESWKEIASYLRRSERTVRRWEEREGLPVHRLQHDKRGSVYAYRQELDAWIESRRLLAPSLPEGAAVAGSRGFPMRWAGIVAGCFMLAASAYYWRSHAASREYEPKPEALRAFQRARFGVNAGRAQVQAGLKYYKEATDLDPLFARAWGGLATAYVAATWFSDLPAIETLEQARSNAQRARQLDPRVGRRVLAYVSHYLDWNHAEAEKLFRESVANGRPDAPTLSWFGDYWVDLGRCEEAYKYYKLAEAADPRWQEPVVAAGVAHLYCGDPGQAGELIRRGLELDPNYTLGNHFLGRYYLITGQISKAVEQFKKSNELLGDVPFAEADLAYAHATAGQRTESERLLRGMLKKREAGYFPAFAIAEAYVGLGDLDQALDWLGRALEEHSVGYYFPTVDPLYRPLRGHPRFAELAQRLGVTQPKGQASYPATASGTLPKRRSRE